MDPTTPQIDLHDQLSAFLSLPVAALAFAAAVTWILAARAQAKTGPVIAADRPGRSMRVGVLVVLLLAVLAWVVVTREIPLVPASIAVLLAILTVVLTPGVDDAASGEEGVRRGWHGRSFAELEEWRLTGDHLRFRLFGEWTSVPLPSAEQPRIRERLLKLVPERESPFQD